MTEWIPEFDSANVKPGARVRLTLGATLIEADTITPPNHEHIRANGKCLHEYMAEGWSLFVEAKPIEVPTEPGAYQDADFPVSDGWDAFQLYSNGEWWRTGHRVQPGNKTTFQRLSPEADTRKAAIKEVAEWLVSGHGHGVIGNINVANRIRRHFGVADL